MTIGFKKLSELIDEEVGAIPNMSASQRKVLTNLCKKVYLVESSSTSGVSPQKINEQMRGEIANVADQLVEGK